MKQVTEYINKQKSPQKEIINKLRKIIQSTLKDSQERMAWGVLAYKKGKFYLVGLKDSVNLGFAIKGLPKDDIKKFEGSGKTMRHLKFKSKEKGDVKEIDKQEKQIIRLLRLVDKKAECSSCLK